MNVSRLTWQQISGALLLNRTSHPPENLHLVFYFIIRCTCTVGGMENHFFMIFIVVLFVDTINKLKNFWIFINLLFKLTQSLTL